MPFPLALLPKQRVAPVRWVTPRWDWSVPVVDTRGGPGDAPAPRASLVAGERVEVTLVRHMIGPEAPLFLEATGDLSIVSPAGGGALPSDTSVRVELGAPASAASGAAPTMAELRARLGSATGPVLGTLAVSLFEPLTLRLALLQANGGAPVDLAAFDTLAAILRQAGIRLRYHPGDATTPTLRPAGGQNFGITGVADIQDTVNGDNAAHNGFVEEHLNVYFVTALDLVASDRVVSVLGLGISGQMAASASIERPVVFIGPNTGGMSVAECGRLIAHEIGHVLDLPHVDFATTADPANIPFDTFIRRNLMHPVMPFEPLVTPTPPGGAWRDDVGFGPETSGHMLTLKSIPRRAEGSDDQVAIMREYLASGRVYRV